MVKEAFRYQIIGVHFFVETATYNVGQGDGYTPNELSNNGDEQTNNQWIDIVVRPERTFCKQFWRWDEQREIQEDK